MKIVFCGGAGEVGASCILVKIGGRNIVLDCGIRMGAARDQMPDMRSIQENGGVDAIIISHAHMDHSGSLPVLSREYPEARIYMTHATRDLIRVLLYDSLKIMEGKEAEIPVFAEVHVKNMLDRTLCFSPGYTFYPFNDNIAVTFYNAGHVAGSACIYITTGEESLFYSGDFSVTPQRTVEGASIPKLRPDVAIFESTYGDRLHSNRELEEERLISKVQEIILSGKKILIPAFALGRAQEVILVLRRAINKGRLPGFKIYVDGMVNDICRVYKSNPNYLRNQLAKKLLKGSEIFYDENVIAVIGRQQQRNEIIASNEACCIIASSGMLTGGPSQWYAGKLAADEGNYIAITGYQDEEAPGRQLLELLDAGNERDKVLKLGDSMVPVRCGIGKYGLSAHADKTEIISLVHSLGARRLFFIHGDPQVTGVLAAEVHKELPSSIYAPVNGEEFDINIRNPRRQQNKAELPAMIRESTPGELDMEELWSFVLSKFGVARGFTAEELLYIWTGRQVSLPEDIPHFIRLINASRYFEAETRRPFIFHAVDKDKLQAEETEEYMEVNKMLALVDSYFPYETGLYRKGARFDEKKALLYFNFPQVAKERYHETIRDFENETGWKAELNNECNAAAAQNIINGLLSTDIKVVGNISYYPANQLFKVKLNKGIHSGDQIIAAFKEKTGMSLEIEISGVAAEAKASAPAKAHDYQMEQNKALAIIEDAFRNTPDRLYKKGIKNINGEPSIELSFLSPAVGERYREVIDSLEASTRWPIKINPVPNQNEAINIARRILDERNIAIKKNIAYMPKEMEVRVVVCDAGHETLEEIKNEFEEVTGLKIKFF